MAWNTFALPGWRGSRFDGHLDVVSNGTVSGWALDRRNPRARMSVLIKSKDFSVLTTADNYRGDLVSALGHDGYHGFSVGVGAAIAEGEPVHAWIGDYRLRNSPRIMQVTGTAFVGHVDVASNGIVSGWAFNRKAPRSHVAVLVKSEDLRLVVMAESYRSDLVEVLGSDGFHGFELYTGMAIPDGAPVECYIANTDHVLDNSPMIMRGDGIARPYFAMNDVSRAYVQALIHGAYRALLQRTPGDEEVASQMRRFIKGLSITEFLSEVMNSDEAKRHRQMQLGRHTLNMEGAYQVLEGELIARLANLGINVQLTKVSGQEQDVLGDAQLLRQALRALG